MPSGRAPEMWSTLHLWWRHFLSVPDASPTPASLHKAQSTARETSHVVPAAPGPATGMPCHIIKPSLFVYCLNWQNRQLWAKQSHTGNDKGKSQLHFYNMFQKMDTKVVPMAKTQPAARFKDVLTLWLSWAVQQVYCSPSGNIHSQTLVQEQETSTNSKTNTCGHAWADKRSWASTWKKCYL